MTLHAQMIWFIDVMAVVAERPAPVSLIVVRSRWPAIVILIASGHVRLPLADLPPNGRFLAKPYRAEAMMAELHSLVGRAAPPMQAQG